MNLAWFYMLWIFSSYIIKIQYFWFGMIILRILFKPITHKNISLPLQVLSNIYPRTKHVIVFFMFSNTKTFAAVITMHFEPVLTHIVIKEDAEHGMDIITAVCAEQYLIYSAQAHKNLGMFLFKIYVKI